MFTVDIYLTFR